MGRLPGTLPCREHLSRRHTLAGLLGRWHRRLECVPDRALSGIHDAPLWPPFLHRCRRRYQWFWPYPGQLYKRTVAAVPDPGKLIQSEQKEKEKYVNSLSIKLEGTLP